MNPLKLLIPDGLDPVVIDTETEAFSLLQRHGTQTGYCCIIRLDHGTYLAMRVADGILTGRPNPRALAATAYLGAAFALPGAVVIGGLSEQRLSELVNVIADQVAI